MACSTFLDISGTHVQNPPNKIASLTVPFCVLTLEKITHKTMFITLFYFILFTDAIFSFVDMMSPLLFHRALFFQKCSGLSLYMYCSKQNNNVIKLRTDKCFYCIEYCSKVITI